MNTEADRNIATGRDFIDAWNARDAARIMAHLTEECVYHNIPMAPLTGTAAIRGAVDRVLSTYDEIDWITHAIAATASGSVLTERADRFRIGTRWIDVPVMGIFEFRDGKISAWRDYFDLAMFTSQLKG